MLSGLIDLVHLAGWADFSVYTRANPGLQAGCLFCSVVSLSFSAYSIAIADIEQRLNASYLLSVAGVSLFTLTFGMAPLILAPLSEVSLRQVTLHLYVARRLTSSADMGPQTGLHRFCRSLYGLSNTSSCSYKHRDYARCPLHCGHRWLYSRRRAGWNPGRSFQ